MAYDTGAAEPLPAAAPASAGADPDDDSEAQAAADQAARYAAWRARSQRTKTKKQNGFIPDWSTNRDYRRGKSSADAADSTRIRSVVDWAFTKAKAAQLFSQVPEVRGEAKLPELAPAVPVFVRELNEALGKAKVGVAMDEALPDVINAAGIGVVLMAYEAITEMRKALKVDISLMTPEQAEMVKQMPGAYEDVPFVLDQRFTATHISPDDFLWPLEFKGSDFDKSPWLGYTGRATWTQARQMFPKLTDEDKDAVLGQRDRSKEQAGSDDERDGEEMVEFDDIYYRAFCYDADCKSYSVIKRITFVRGKDEPVVDENWKGQRPLPDGRYVGACDYPVRVLTLTYMSDEAIPPSDSAMGRPMVDELIKSRSQAYEQREFSKPMRWFDVNRVDPTIMDQLMAGTYQGMIPTQGPGDRVIGEVARASFPRETFELENLLKEEIGRAHV